MVDDTVREELVKALNRAYPNHEFYVKHGLVAFVDKESGIEIVNPIRSVCGRFGVDGTQYGLSAEWARTIHFYNVGVAIIIGVPQEYVEILDPDIEYTDMP